MLIARFYHPLPEPPGLPPASPATVLEKQVFPIPKTEHKKSLKNFSSSIVSNFNIFSVLLVMVYSFILKHLQRNSGAPPKAAPGPAFVAALLLPAGAALPSPPPCSHLRPSISPPSDGQCSAVCVKTESK